MFRKLLVQAVRSEPGSGIVVQERPVGVWTAGRAMTFELISGE
jgi:hypothetical protein